MQILTFIVNGNLVNPGANTDINLPIPGGLSKWFILQPRGLSKYVIDEIALYDRALSHEEITSIYNNLVGTMNKINPGQNKIFKVASPTLSEGAHTLRLCTASACNTAVLTITQ